MFLKAIKLPYFVIKTRPSNTVQYLPLTARNTCQVDMKNVVFQ